MKKIIMILFLIIGLFGCQREAIEMRQGEIYVIENQVQIEIIKTTAATSIEPSNKNTYNQNIKAQDNHMFVDCLVKITNLSSDQKKLNELLLGKYEMNNQTYDLQMILETINYNQLTTTDTLKQNQERYTHLYCEIPKEDINTSITLKLTLCNQSTYHYTFTIDQTKIETSNYQSLGDVISLKDSQLTLNQMAQSKRIEPSHKGIFYSYIPTENEDETFVYLQIDIHNVSQHTIKLNDYVYCEYKTKNETYPSQMIIETENHKSLEKAGNIEPLEIRTLYFASAVNDKQLKEKGVFEVFVEGQTFQIEGQF